jgi:hypothetical protein
VIFGLHRFPVSISGKGWSIVLNEAEKLLSYRRESPVGVSERGILDVPEGIVMHPVEPLNTPKRISPYLLIEFSKALVVGPHSTQSVFLKFPVETGVFLPRGNDHDLLDILSLNPTKYTLYGTPRGGLVCRFWRSDVFRTVPKTNTVYEGVLKLEITNSTDTWVPLRKSVLDVHGMKIYYKDAMVAAWARMTLLSETKAESEFVDSPLEEGMLSSIELFRLGKLAVASSRFYMSEGL